MRMSLSAAGDGINSGDARPLAAVSEGLPLPASNRPSKASASSSGHTEMKNRQQVSKESDFRSRRSRGRSRFRSASKHLGQPPADHHEAPACSWANVAQLAVKGSELSYVPPTFVEGEAVVNLPDEALDAMDPKWHDCLVGQLVAKWRLPFGLVEQVLRKTWGSKIGEIFADDQGFFFLQIPDPGFRRKILEDGPVTIARVPLILRQWKPLMDLKREEQSTIPVWIRLRNLPFDIWTVPAMSAIASVAGKPLYVDQRTNQMKMVSFARVCVEVTANQPRVEKAKVTLKGVSRVINIEYEWLPIACPDCNAFGHNCRAPPRGNPTRRTQNAGQAVRHPARQTSIAPAQPVVHAPDPRMATPPSPAVLEQDVQRPEVDPDPPRVVDAPLPPQSDIDPVRLQPSTVSMQTSPTDIRDSPQPTPALPEQDQPWRKVKNRRKRNKDLKIGESPLPAAADQPSEDRPPVAAPPPSASARKGSRGASAPLKVVLSLTAGSRPTRAPSLKDPGKHLEEAASSSEDDDISSPGSPFQPPRSTDTSVETIQHRLLSLALDSEPVETVEPSGASRRRPQKLR